MVICLIKSMLSLMHLIHHVVHMYIKKNYKKIKLNYKKGKKQRPFGLGALGHQVISVHFQPKKKKKLLHQGH